MGSIPTHRTMKYELVDCCPAPAKLAPVLKKIKAETGCVYQSIYRGHDAAALLARCGKHDQAWIYAHYPPGVANPPGRSTHELKNDGSAYRGWVGMPLRYWQCGLDIDDAHVKPFIQAAARHGWTASITYPNSRVEYHHVNFRKEPRLYVSKPLHRGDIGPRVKVMTRRLAFVRKPDGHSRYLKHSYWTFTRETEIALRQYQADHHQKPDGVFGLQTSRQLQTSVRYWKNKEKK